MKFLLVGLVFFFPNWTSAQVEEIEYVTAVEVEYPNFVSDTSETNLHAERRGYKLISITPGPCQGNVERDTTFVGIINHSTRNDTLIVVVSIIEACCRSFIGEIELINDTTLSLNYTGYGDECMCFCCYQMTYKAIAKSNMVNTFLLNNEKDYFVYKAKKLAPVLK